jgi:hypothetical protein
MDYRIHHLDLVDAAEQRSIFEEEIQKKIPALREILYNYAIKPVLHIFIKKENTDQYTIYASMQLKGKDILIKEFGMKTAAIVHNVLEKLISQAKEQLELNSA